jgi:Flavodoxin reductases (ferredoxin-NADPH reductases) family 1
MVAHQAISADTGVKDSYRVLVRSMTYLARDTLAVELTGAEGDVLPAFTAGAHVDLALPNGIRRSYSLCNRPGETDRFVVGVKKANPSRGASAFIHESLRVGQVISVSAPRNLFPLSPDAATSVLIAGGIGITPIWAMIQTLEAEGRPWCLYYSARTAEDAAFLGAIRTLADSHPGRVEIRFDHEPGAAMLDLGAIVAEQQGAGVHFYCCGPGPMLDAFEAATARLPSGQVHLERFSAEPQTAAEDALDAFEVVLAQSGQVLAVEPGISILDTLLDAGVDIPFSCMDGICGSCRVGVREGVPDHRDMVLTDDERARNDTMMVCCSGSRSSRLVLDL